MRLFDTFSLFFIFRPDKLQCEVACIDILKEEKMTVTEMEYIRNW